MKRRFFLIALCLVPIAVGAASFETSTLSLLETCLRLAVRQDEAPQERREVGSPKGKMVIANRASGTISVVNAASDQVIGTYAELPGILRDAVRARAFAGNHFTKA